MTSDLPPQPPPLLLPPAAEAEVDHEVEGGVENRQQMVDADQDKDPLKRN